jgi:hypothetical protein
MLTMLKRMFGSRKFTLEGRVVLNALPRSCGYMVQAVFFPVDGPNSPPPFDGEPPLEAYADAQAEMIVVVEGEMDKDTRCPVFVTKPKIDIPFMLSINCGHYYMGFSVIIFRECDGELTAQKEVFFVRDLTISSIGDAVNVGDLSFTWPDTDCDDLFVYAKFEPNKEAQFYEGDKKVQDLT